MATGVASWSKTAATNATADANVNWAEGMAPSAVNDSARAEMASVAMWRDDTNGSITTGGSSTAYTVTSNQSFASLTAMDNAVIAFIPHTTSGTAPTLAVDGLTAKKIRFVTATDLPSGALIAGTPYVVTYEHGVGEFLVHNLATFDHYCPLGAGFDYWGSTAPNGSYAFAYGQAISRTTYAGLFTLFGTTYGTGDGSTTFNIPDKRGRVSAGKDDMGGSDSGRLGNASFFGSAAQSLGGTGGSESHTLTSSEMPSHTHTADQSSHTHTSTSGTRYAGGSTAGAASGTAFTAPAGAVDLNGELTGSADPTITVSSTGGGGAHNNVQPTIICNYIIRVL